MKRKVNPLVEHGHKVFISYDSPAFEQRQRTSRSGWTYTTSKNPSADFQKWLTDTAGPMGILWMTVKAEDRSGLNIYFYNPTHAMLAKLTWGGK